MFFGRSSTTYRKHTPKPAKQEESVKQLLQRWETGEPYRFKIFYDEISTVKLGNENVKLKNEKRKAGESLAQETAKRLNVEEKLNTALKKAETKGTFFQKRFKNLAKKIAREQMKKKGRGPAKGKRFSQYSKKQQKRITQKKWKTMLIVTLKKKPLMN